MCSQLEKESKVLSKGNKEEQNIADICDKICKNAKYLAIDSARSINVPNMNGVVKNAVANERRRIANELEKASVSGCLDTNKALEIIMDGTPLKAKRTFHNLEGLCAVEKMVEANGAVVEGYEKEQVVLFNTDVISADEVFNLMQTGAYDCSSKIVIVDRKVAEYLADYKIEKELEIEEERE